MFKNAKDETDENWLRQRCSWLIKLEIPYAFNKKKKRKKEKSHTLNEELQGLSAIVDYIAAEEASSISFSKMIS